MIKIIIPVLQNTISELILLSNNNNENIPKLIDIFFIITLIKYNNIQIN